MLGVWYLHQVRVPCIATDVEVIIGRLLTSWLSKDVSYRCWLAGSRATRCVYSSMHGAAVWTHDISTRAQSDRPFVIMHYFNTSKGCGCIFPMDGEELKCVIWSWCWMLEVANCWSDLPGAELEWPWSGEAANSVRAVGCVPTFNVSIVEQGKLNWNGCVLRKTRPL